MSSDNVTDRLSVRSFWVAKMNTPILIQALDWLHYLIYNTTQSDSYIL